MRTITEIQARIRAAAAEAARGCGQSDVLFEARLQAAYAAILEQAPDEDRPVVEAALLESGFDPGFEPYVAGPGECGLTGIEVDCCPCGQHE
jgi:hypothetical protein